MHAGEHMGLQSPGQNISTCGGAGGAIGSRNPAISESDKYILTKTVNVCMQEYDCVKDSR